MFYETQNHHGLRHNPFKALVSPRPIGWISTVSKDGICNLAPYSFFNAISDRPPYVVFSSGGRKDSVINAEETGEFVCCFSNYALRDHMNLSSVNVPYGVDEFPIAGLTATPSQLVKPPRIKESPAALECRYWKTIELPPVAPGGPPGNLIVIGYVTGVFIDDSVVHDGMVDTAAMQPLARLGYMDYAYVTADTMLRINRPELEADGTVTVPPSKAG